MAKTKTENVHYYDLATLSYDVDDFSDKEREFLEEAKNKSIYFNAIGEVMEFLYEWSHELFNCDRLSLAFVRDAGRRMSNIWMRTVYDTTQLERGFTYDIERTSLAQPFERGSARIINDLEAYYRENPNSDTTRKLVDEGIRSSMAFPLIIDDQGVGFIFRNSRQKHAFSEHHVCLQKAASDLMGPSIEKAYRLDQLAEANAAYLEMLGFVSHELKSPLASIILDARILRDAYLGPLNDEQKKKLDNVITRASYLMDLVKDYLDLARIEGGNIRLHLLEEVDLFRDIIQPGVEIVSAQARQKKIKIDVERPEKPMLIQADPELLRIAILNLIDNAVKYGREGGNVSVTLNSISNGVFISVWNEGPGFSEKQQSKLFRRFSRLNTREMMKQKGTGLGLYTTWRILRLHGGKIEARSEEGLWAEFQIRIPQPVEAQTILN